MIPYADFLYFGVLLYVLLPTLLLRAAFGFSRTWVMLVTFALLIVHHGGNLFSPPMSAAPGSVWLPERMDPGATELLSVAVYAVFQWLTATGFLRLRALTARSWPYYAALFLALLPLLITKLLPSLAPGS